jgi:putative transposase
VKYAFIESCRAEHAVTRMCGWLEVSPPGYYKWRKRGPSNQARRRAHVRDAVVIAFEQSKRRYGAPRVTVELNEAGIACSLNHVAQLMAESGLRARNGKGYKYFPAPNRFNHVSDNLLKRNFTACRPNEKWVSDITYIKVRKGYVYLAVIMDLYARQIVGWAMSSQMTADLILEAFTMAVGRRQIKPGVILHSDRGVQYRSGEYQRALLDQGMQPSMSRKGNCWDNAAMESFFARLKVESVHMETFSGLGEAYTSVFEYIEMFYNRVRRHSANGYKSPLEYENMYYARCA